MGKQEGQVGNDASGCRLCSLPPPSPQALREVRRDTPLRRARTCYGHLAGVAGVELMDKLLLLRWLEAKASPSDDGRIFYAPTEAGASALRECGVILPRPKAGKPVAFSCLDWTERRRHLGGLLGRAVADALIESGCVRRVPGSRVVELDGHPVGFLLLDASAGLR